MATSEVAKEQKEVTTVVTVQKEVTITKQRSIETTTQEVKEAIALPAPTDDGPDLNKIIEEIFWKTDTDRSGTLSRDELKVMLIDNGYKLTDKEMEKIFTDADANHDNEISFDEYLSSMGRTPAEVHKQAMYRVQFKQFDKNGDGMLNKEEVYSVYKDLGSKKTKKEIDAIFDSIDTDGSGQIEYEEYIKHMVDKLALKM